MKKEYVAGLIILLLVFGSGILLFSQKQSKVLTPSNNEPTVTTSETSPSPVVNMTGSVTGTTDKVDESKNQISLVVAQPTDGQVVNTSTITVNGLTSPNADVSVNDVDLKADTKGNFSTSVKLDEGDNSITIVAVDSNGLSAEKDLTVTYNSGQTYR